MSEPAYLNETYFDPFRHEFCRIRKEQGAATLTRIINTGDQIVEDEVYHEFEDYDRFYEEFQEFWVVPEANVGKSLTVIDMFCGAGGFTTGVVSVAQEKGLGLKLLGINHWDRAVESMEANYPWADVYLAGVEDLYICEIIDSDVDLLVAGPECTHFSNAAGGRPVDPQKRMSLWSVLEYVQKLAENGTPVQRFIVENVPELKKFGAVVDGEAKKDGKMFELWVEGLNQYGYNIDWEQLKAMHYGDPTSRERLFVCGKLNGQVDFPDPTHIKEGDEAGTNEVRTAAEIIDWSDTGESIWTRDLTHKRVHTPPKDTTMKRIAEGVRRHSADWLEPFADALEQLGRDEIRTLRNTRAVPSEYAGLLADAIDEPFLVHLPDHNREVSNPTAAGETVLLRQQDGGQPCNVRDRSVPTIPTGGGHALATPLTTLIEPKNGLFRSIHSNPLYPPASRPFHTLTTDPRAKLVSPSLVRYSHGGATLDIDDPMPTIATERGGVFALSSPFLTPLYNGRATQRPRTRALDRPLMTIPASKTPACLTEPILRPFIDDYEASARSLTRPLGTVTTRDKFALCVPKLYPWGIDVEYRMLKPTELMQAQGFDPDYELSGTKTDQVEQIGNSVPVHLAAALVRNALEESAPALSDFTDGAPAEA
jgi:DNA (cytosine-5)-methyltransferase 1